MKNFKPLLIAASCLLLSSCAGFFDKDNTPTPTPLVDFSPEAKISNRWSTGTGGGVSAEYLRLVPAVTAKAIFTASKDGTVTATDKASGRTLWSVNTSIQLSGGPASYDNKVFVGGRDGEVIALSQNNGTILWQTRVASEVLAAPTADANVVLVKSIDGTLSALSTQNGQLVWYFKQVEPTLILRCASAPQISGDSVVVGFSNGNLAKLSLQNGRLQWQQTIAEPQGSFAIERMIDIDADPIIYHHKIYAATYQGRISAFDLYSGKTFWTHDISSFTGMAVDQNRVYVSDAKGDIWAFDNDSGAVVWRQTQLQARNTSGPAVMGNYLVVGDQEGYVHWLSKQDGHFVARVRASRSGVLAAPVVDNNIAYVFTSDGQLSAYTLG